MAGRVEGKVALITGAAGGLGTAMAHRLAEQGARLVLTDLDGDRVQALADAINALRPETARAHAHDVTRAAHWDEVAAATERDFGALAVLVHNAGVGGGMAFVDAVDIDEWRRVHAINVESVVLGSRACMPLMKASQPASIIVISSMAGLLATPGMGAYNASKAAVAMTAKTIAMECARQKLDIRCNSVHPVFIRTPILDPFVAMAGGDEAEAHRRLARGIPMGRIGEPDDVAYAVLYLASDESRFVTGIELLVDGGMAAQ